MPDDKHRKRSGTYVYYRCTRMRRLPTGRCREPAISERDLVKQLADELGKLATGPEVLEWIRVDGEAEVRAELARVSSVRHSLEHDLKALDREDEALLSLRIRDLVTDEVFKEKRADIQARRIAAQSKLAGPERTVEELHQLVVTTLTFGADVRRAFLQGPPSRQRTILEAVGADYILQGRRVRFTLGAPFDALAKANEFSKYPSETGPLIVGIVEPSVLRSTETTNAPLRGGGDARLRIVDVVRTFVARNPDFRLPDLNANEPDLSLPYSEAAA